ncbi:hypothetical protein MRB53_017005 [Persea americana]|uniref:Uncharacterized protein n=1 Tax=Persea americana TaxID=3435 RepID=A0ACC2M4P1_PERAE|nr:hypothetical protein MRB53_017005 [Persea americana]
MIGNPKGQVGGDEGASGASSGCAMKECRWVNRGDARGASGQWLGRGDGAGEPGVCVQIWEEDGAWRRWVVRDEEEGDRRWMEGDGSQG